MSFDPATSDLSPLFRDPRMFDSRSAFRRAGFDVFDPAKDTEIMVAAHPAAPGFLFKKYIPGTEKRERENYASRVAGADKLRELIAARDLHRIVVPRKWIRDLPIGGQILIVDRLPILSSERSIRAFRDIDDTSLRELCVVLYEIRGLDSNAKNIAITDDGKIAFVDTENWRRDKEGYLRRIKEYLPKDRRKLAKKIFAELDR